MLSIGQDGLMESGQEPSKLRTALSRYVQARSTALTEARRELSIGEGDAKALLFITANPGCRAADIAGHLGITAAGVTALVDRLVERGVVEREYDQDDRRVIHISCTIDLADEPWVALNRFDHHFDRILGTNYDPDRSDEFALMLDELLGEIQTASSKAR
jgi:hypothetical protein